MAEKKPLFSILHTSARPDQWRKVYDDWMSKACHPEDVEYVLCIDPRWGFSTHPEAYDVKWFPPTGGRIENLVVVQNTGRRCYVDGVNIAAKASSGSILIVNADDQFACEDWDRELLAMLLAVVESQPYRIQQEGAWVLDVNTGTPPESAHRVCQMPILSRKRYEDQGSEVFYHEYESMCADNDFREWAVQDGVLIDAYHLLFPHKHPLYGQDGKWQKPDPAKWDEAYRVQNREEAYKTGAALLERRRAAKFQPVSSKRFIAMCYPGDDFRGRMVDSLMNIWAHLVGELDFAVLRVRSYSPNVYQVREDTRRQILASPERPELILWMDHDNPLEPAQFNQLLAHLDAHPEVDGIAGWCWIYDSEHKKGFAPSCGLWAPDHMRWQPFDSSFARETQLKPMECGGLPCFLMRASALFDKAGSSPFLPILDSRLDLGLLGEDFCFFLRSESGGAKFLVDPKIRVPHLKYVDVEPTLPEEGAPLPVKVACMLRVRNEGRWLKRVIDAVRPLCGEHIYVMEDGSTDDTVPMILAAGGKWFRSPFVGQGLNEIRDKNWLLAEVKRRCPDADWIFMPDGDEELEPGGCEKIRRVLESNPNVDCFALRILNLWNSVDTIRLDGVYGNMNRQSLFRANSNLEFQPCYPGGNENHVVLHVSNAPGLGGPRLAPLNVCLLHYGYLHKEDRLRKFEWISKLDPDNEAEGGYLHMIQGDPPAAHFCSKGLRFSVQSEEKLTHAGPLELRKLPAHLIPKWEGAVPGPFTQRPLGTCPDCGNSEGMHYSGCLSTMPDEVQEERTDTRFDGRYKLSKLNLGCCDRRVPGYLGVDLVPGAAVDVVADLSKPWPWPDSSVEEIIAHDVIEHLPDKIQTMNETWRVLKPGGKAEIVVPTVEGPGAFQDPTHVSFWHRHSFWYFEAGSPYRERFANSYGIQARFKVVRELEELTGDGPKLRIVLEKVA